jgi:membrane protein YdbS with pleckstrin-like domain
MRYLLHSHPTFPDLLSKDELYELVERSSLARGDLCTDTLTNRDHTVGEVISQMRPPSPSSTARLSRPAYQEFRADSPLDDELEEEEPEEEAEPEPPKERFTASGERLLFFSHPSWFRYVKALFFFSLLVTASVMLLFIDAVYSVVTGLLALATLIAVMIARSCRDYLVTEDRVEVLWGILGRSSNEVRICDIRSLDVRESGIKGILGIGTLDASSAANAGIEVSFHDIRKPHEVKELIRRLQRGAPADQD